MLIPTDRVALQDGPAESPVITVAVLQATIKSLHADSVARVVIVGPLPEWPMPLQQIYFRDSMLHKHVRDNLEIPDLPEQFAVIDRGGRAAAIEACATYVSLRDAMCQGALCFTKIPDWPVEALAQFDERDLTSEALEWVAERAIGPAMGMGSSNTSQAALASNEKLEFHENALALKYFTSGWMTP